MRYPARLRARLFSRGDPAAGYTLVEVTVALMLSVVLLISLTITVGNAFRAVRDNRTLQQATSLAIESVEFARSVAWADLANGSPVLATDPLLLTGPRRLDGPEVGLPAPEELVESPGSGWIQTYRTEQLDETEFSVKSYVTDAGTGLRRITVVVEWTRGNNDRQHFTSALISEVSAQ